MRALCLLDSGSEVCLVPTKYVKMTEVRPASKRLFAADGTLIPLLGEALIRAELGDVIVYINGFVSDNINDLILGVDFMKKNRAVWNFDTGIVELNGIKYELEERANKENWCRRVVCEESVLLPPKSESIVSGRVMLHSVSGSNIAGQWASNLNRLTPSVSVAQVLIPERLSNVPMRVLNTGETAAYMKKGSTIADLEQVEVCEYIEDENSSSDLDPIQAAVIGKMIDGIDESITKSEKEELRALLTEFKSVFAFSENELGRTSATRHEIDTGNARPIKQRLRRQPGRIKK